MPAPNPIGYEGKLYYKVGGIAGGGSWTELTNVRDVTINSEDTEVDVTTRASGGHRAVVQGLRTYTIEFEMVWDTSDTGFNALRDAFLNRTAIGIKAFELAAGQGPQFDGVVLTMTRNEPLDDVDTASITVKPTRSATAPSWATS